MAVVAGSWRGARCRASACAATETIKKTADVARKDPQPVSVRIHKLNGRIQEERTYPRSADPGRSKG